MFSEDCPFKVVRTNGSDEVLARAANLLIGQAAFETAKRLYPKDVLEYRKGAMVLDKSGGGGGWAGRGPGPPQGGGGGGTGQEAGRGPPGYVRRPPLPFQATRKGS